MESGLIVSLIVPPAEQVIQRLRMVLPVAASKIPAHYPLARMSL